MSGPDEVFVFGCWHGRSGVRWANWSGDPQEGWSMLCLADRPSNGCPQTEGHKASSWSSDGWSFVSWWDRQGVDKRRGQHTGLLARGTWTIDELVAAGRRLTPWAFRVELHLTPDSR